MRIIVSGPLAAILLAYAGGCSQAPDPKFHGLSSGQVSAFTRTPSGCVMSLLFDDFQAPAVRKGKATGAPLRTFTIVSSPAAAGSEMTFDIRGARINAADSTIRLEVDGQQFKLQPDSDEYLIRTRARTNQKSADTLVKVTLDLPAAEPPNPDALLNIDSIDVALPSCGSQAAGSE